LTHRPTNKAASHVLNAWSVDKNGQGEPGIFLHIEREHAIARNEPTRCVHPAQDYSTTVTSNM